MNKGYLQEIATLGVSVFLRVSAVLLSLSQRSADWLSWLRSLADLRLVIREEGKSDPITGLIRRFGNYKRSTWTRLCGQPFVLWTATVCWVLCYVFVDIRL